MHQLFLLAIGIGFVAGLRSLTAPAIVSWGAHLGWIDLHDGPLAFMGSPVAVGIFTLLAILELVGDKLPKTPPRTATMPFVARLIMGALCGACIYSAGAASPAPGAVFGIIGAVIGTFAGYHIRRALVTKLNVKDILIAVPEDVIAIVLAYVIVRSTLS